MNAHALEMDAAAAVPEPVEVEIKLLAADAAPLRKLARRRRLGPARLGQLTRVSEVDRYLDTVDGRLAAAGWACRLRTRGSGSPIISLKGAPLARPAGGRMPPGIHRRPELEGPAGTATDPAGWLPSAARTKLMSLAGGLPLVERFVLHQGRSQRVVQVGALRVGLLTLDRVAVQQGRRLVGRLWSVELELVPGADGASPLVDALLAALQAVPGLRTDRMSKLQHAEAMLRRDPG
jgi:inorganic triphosphatase YgiF